MDTLNTLLVARSKVKVLKSNKNHNNNNDIKITDYFKGHVRWSKKIA